MLRLGVFDDLLLFLKCAFSGTFAFYRFIFYTFSCLLIFGSIMHVNVFSNPFERCPTEIKNQIFSFIKDPKDLKNLALVNRKFSECVSSYTQNHLSCSYQWIGTVLSENELDPRAFSVLIDLQDRLRKVSEKVKNASSVLTARDFVLQEYLRVLHQVLSPKNPSLFEEFVKSEPDPFSLILCTLMDGLDCSVKKKTFVSRAINYYKKDPVLIEKAIECALLDSFETERLSFLTRIAKSVHRHLEEEKMTKEKVLELIRSISDVEMKLNFLIYSQLDDACLSLIAQEPLCRTKMGLTMRVGEILLSFMNSASPQEEAMHRYYLFSLNIEDTMIRYTNFWNVISYHTRHGNFKQARRVANTVEIEELRNSMLKIIKEGEKSFRPFFDHCY